MPLQDSLDTVPIEQIKRFFPDDPNVQAMITRIEQVSISRFPLYIPTIETDCGIRHRLLSLRQLTTQLASLTDQLDALRADNFTLKSLSSPSTTPNMERRGSTISMRAERAIAMEAAFKGIPPPVQILPGGVSPYASLLFASITIPLPDS